MLAQAPYHGTRGLLLSVSGGLDSMVLLDVFARSAHIHESPLQVVHFHHHTGDFARNAYDLVRARAEALGLPLTVLNWIWDGTGNFEYKAAQYRRTALEELREEGQWVVLAHHSGDQAETILQTLVRGAGISTPVGMASSRFGRLRPFLNLPRKALEEHGEMAGLNYLNDPSNEDCSHFRNALRHRVVPELKRFHQSFETNMAGWAADYQELQDGLNTAAVAIFERYFSKGLLLRKAFNQEQVYLWDFILKLFWERQDLGKPQRKEQAQLRTWLKDGVCGVFDHGGKRCCLDQDGLILQEPVRARTARYGEIVDWGSWRFKLVLHNDMEMQLGETYAIALHEALPKPLKEYLRRRKVPYRVRNGLPLFTLGGETYHLHQVLEQERSGILSILHVSGEPLTHWVRNMKETRA